MASLAHAMGHVLGSVFGIPHGRAVSICLPYTIEFAAGEEPSRISDLASVLGIQISNADVGRQFSAAIQDLLKITETPLNLKDLGINGDDFDSQIDKLVDDSFNDTQIITAPRTPSFQELEKIYRYAFRGQPIDF